MGEEIREARVERCGGDACSAAATECRLIVHGPASGAWNMAVDEAILLEAEERGRTGDGARPTLRLYRWERATLSLGYFQPWREAGAERLASLPIVRRLTGGGAIVHDREITYSLVVPRGHRLGREPRCLYRRVHEAFALALSRFDARVERRVESRALRVESANRADTARHEGEETDAWYSQSSTLNAQPYGLGSGRAAFLCFRRADEDDLVRGRAKVVGSAQRRRRGAVLQHGSIVLRPSAYAPDLEGVFSSDDALPPVEALNSALALGVGEVLGSTMVAGGLTAAEHRRAQDLAVSKYGHPAWNQRR